MTIMTEYQRELVEQNLELVTQVIRKRIKVNGTVLQSYDDFYSVGCEALAMQPCGIGPRWGSLHRLPAY